MLQVRQLSCVRGGRLLWQDLEFALPPGKLLHITGANGCGKTTLLRVLASLAPPSSGTVYWQGKPITQHRGGYQQQLHYIGHQPAVKSELTVRENLQFNGRQAVKQSCLTAIEQMGLTAHIDHYGDQLSQGQKQRVALARLFCSPAPLWILDEPLAGLDTEMAATLQGLFVTHLRQGGMIIVTTHRPLTAVSLSDQVQLDRA